MKKIITAINIIIAIYFFILANLFFWGYFLVLLGMAFGGKGTLKILWSSNIEMIFAPFLIYGSIIFFRKTKKKYLYGLIILGIVWVESLVYRLLFVTHGKLEEADLSNFFFFGIPFIVILLTRYLDKKISEGAINSRIFYKIFIIVISIALVTGGFFTWQYFGVPKGEAPKEGTQDETADWQTYRNEEYGFEIEYPKNLYFKGWGAKNLEFRNDDLAVFLEILNNPQLFNLHDYIVNEYGKNGPLIYKDLIKNEWVEWVNEKRGTIDIWTYGFVQNIEGFESDAFLQDTRKLNTVILVRFNTMEENFSENENIYTQMLSTFRFLE